MSPKSLTLITESRYLMISKERRNSKLLDEQAKFGFPIFITTATISHNPQFLVPIHKYIDNDIIRHKVLISAPSGYAVMNIAIHDFCDDGWIVDLNHQNYEEL